ncbi:hypothetical protein HK405_002331, partial [Cladochytrium tenue]
MPVRVATEAACPSDRDLSGCGEPPCPSSEQPRDCDYDASTSCLRDDQQPPDTPPCATAASTASRDPHQSTTTAPSAPWPTSTTNPPAPVSAPAAARLTHLPAIPRSAILDCPLCTGAILFVDPATAAIVGATFDALDLLLPLLPLVLATDAGTSSCACATDLVGMPLSRLIPVAGLAGAPEAGADDATQHRPLLIEL